MANQSQAAGKPAREPRFLLGKFFVDADVVAEPEEPAKIVVAGMAEARIKKEYPEGYFKKAGAVLRSNFALLLKGALWFAPAALVFILVFLVAGPFFEEYVMGGGYNFMQGVGVGLHPGGDNIAQSVATLYRDVYQPFLMMLAGAGIIAAPFIAGLFYCAKRAYYQDFYKRVTRTFFMGFAKYWWKFLITATVGILIALAMGTALINQLTLEQTGDANAGSMAAVVLSFIFGAPLLLIPMVMMSLFTTYGLSLKDAFKDAIVIIVNNPFMTVICGVLSAAPLLLLMINNIFAIIICIAMLIVGFIYWAQCWVAMADRGMTKCKALKAYTDKKKLIALRDRKGGAKNAAKGGGKYEAKSATGAQQYPAQEKKNTPKQAPKPYVNPKKKKKKK